eukprot:CAMPEP_0184657516 /NCGR_PEP_ID=MMETSP0308-20130426/20263_1 /TAXON_ID=38269 /ORGANISM="Gloeochaete witrockiana, Strain SAG 46.84" /LENGTH=506 /DNA_ID=CAMNT_0027095459 /DNA_START=291 /DNA_END=1811 /DNA_ORIENTATION=+
MGIPEYWSRPLAPPWAALPDSTVCAVRLPTSGQFRVWSALGETLLMCSGRNVVTSPVAGRGPLLRPFIHQFVPDSTWYSTRDLQGVIADNDTVVRGWVHIELRPGADPEVLNTHFHGEIAFALSRDGGLSFQPSLFVRARDVVISTERTQKNSNSKNPHGTGSTFAVRVGDYYHIYYREFYAEYPGGNHDAGFCLARARVGTGQRGSWTKYYRGAWSQPGIGGKCSAITWLKGSATTWVTPTSGTVTSPFLVNVPPNYGTKKPSSYDWWFTYGVWPDGQNAVSVSRDGVTWSPLRGNFFPRFNKGDNTTEYHPWILGYSSIIQDEFNKYQLFCMHSEPGTSKQGDGPRHIARYPIRFDVSSRPVLCGGRLSLVRYQLISNSIKKWTTIEPTDRIKWSIVGVIGMSYACPFGNYNSSVRHVELSDCQVVSTGARFPAFAQECTGSSARMLGSRVLLNGPLGYIFATPSPGLIPLYRCYIAATGLFDVSTTGCTRGVLLGYMERPVTV